MSLANEIWGLPPLLAFAGLTGGQVARGRGVVEALLRSAIIWAAGAWALANGLGLFGALLPVPLRIAWLLAAAVALFDGARVRRVDWKWPRLENAGEWVAASACVILVALALLLALVAPPVTIDALNYHLPRQLMWLQQGSLAHYATVNDRELMMPPLAEVIGLQFLALTGSDHWANLPQWFAYALLAPAMALAARTLGASRAAAALAAWLAVCLPMAWIEASNAKNDLQGAFWLLLLLWQVARARQADKPPGSADAAWAGATLALALLTKSTAMIFAPPLLLAGVWAWRRRSGGLPWRPVILAAAVATLLTAPFFLRNFAWYGTPLGVHRAVDGGGQANDAITPAIVASNAIRDATAHLSGPSPQWNALVGRAVLAAHRWLGLSINDPSDTLWVTTFAIAYAPGAETMAGAPWHFALILAALVGVFLWRGGAPWRWLAAVTGAMALLFCATVKWQPWGARLELPAFSVGTLLVAAVLGSLPGRIRTIALWVVAVGGLLAWLPSRETSVRPWWTAPTLFAVPRELNQYRSLPHLPSRDAALAQLVHQALVREVAIVSLHDIAYPLMRRLQRETPGLLFYGAPAAMASKPPGAIILLDPGNPLPLDREWPGGARYRLVGDEPGGGLYLPPAQVRVLGWADRLPPFAGWTTGENLTLRVDAPTVLSVPLMAWSMEGPQAAVLFAAPAVGKMTLKATLRKAATAPESLELTCNGQPLGRFDFPPATGSHSFEVRLPVRAGDNRLELRRPGPPGEPMVFTRLIIDDDFALSGSG